MILYLARQLSASPHNYTKASHLGMILRAHCHEVDASNSPCSLA